MKTRKTLWQHWNERSAWTQFRHIQRFCLAFILIAFSLLLFSARADTGVPAQIAGSISNFSIVGFARITLICGLVTMLWWRAGFWTLFLLALPIHLYIAFTVQGVMHGVFSGQVLAIEVGYELQVFVCLWVAIRQERRQAWNSS